MAEEQLELSLPVEDSQKKRDEWAKKIKEYENSFESFNKKGDKIITRYRDDRSSDQDGFFIKRFNIFWSNVQTLGPATYSRAPKPIVTRRYFDKDPIGRLASSILERSLQYEMDVTDFHSQALLARDDNLLVGRGTLWQRYEPIIESAEQDSDGSEDSEELAGNGEVQGEEGVGTPQPGVEAIGGNGGPKMTEQVIGENAPTDYVHWKDFLHGPAQNWKQVPWVGRRVLMDRASVDARWPDVDPETGKRISSQLSFTHKQEKDDNKQDSKSTIGNLAIIYEIWNKVTFKVLWYSPDLKTRLIEELDDPLRLQDFFPCPKPLYSTMTTDRLVPRPDYSMYEDQARELDVLTQRIHLLMKAIAVRGVYDASNTKLADLLNERPENFMVPVDNWAAFAEKGGLQGQMSFVPIDQVIKVVQILQQARGVIKQDIYEITGIADIIRGASNAQETATAQQIKGQFANMRLSDRRDAMASFLRDSLRIRAEVMAEHFDQSTLRQISGFDQMTEVQDAVKEGQVTADQLWQQAYDMLKNDPLRLTHLDIETDSMIEPDMIKEQTNRVQFLTSIGQFLSQAIDAAQKVPQIAGLLGEMITFAVRGFKVGRELEGAISLATEKLTALAANPPPPPPNPELVRAQAEAQQSQTRMENEAAAHNQKMDLEGKRADYEHQLKLEEVASNERIAILELNLKYGIQAAEAAAQPVAAEEKVISA